MSEEHPLKDELPIDLTEEGISNFINDLHLLKDKSPIDVTDSGIVISLRDKHSEKT